MEHNHCKCEHKNLKYCPHCDIIYCEDCKKEWVKEKLMSMYNYTTFPNSDCMYWYNSTNGIGGSKENCQTLMGNNI